jgi:Fe-Mn family superoxide dismutase
MIKSQILPYQKNSLDPTLSQETLDFHYNKHHLGYEKKLNSLIVSTKYENDTLNKIIIESYKSRDKAIYNNAAQVWNHDFYWSSLNIKSNIPNKIFKLIKKYFKNVNSFNNDLINKGMSLFGSGWLWLIQNKTSGKLSLITTSNADNPLLLLDVVPILTIDLWEHAYYIDYRNDRKTYLNNVVKHLNWNFANNNLIN